MSHCPETPCPHPAIVYQRPDAPPPPNLPPPPERRELPPELCELPPERCELDLWLEDELPELYEPLVYEEVNARILAGS